MAEPTPPRLARSSSRRRRSRGFLRRVGTFLSEWWAEVLIGLLVAFGIFLLFERMQIRQTLLGWVRAGWAAFARSLGSASEGLARFIQSRTLSDLTGLAFLLIAVGIIFWRLRWRLLHTPRFTDRLCPQCGSAIHRVHRRGLDRAVNVLVPVRRYRCDNRECRWSGLRFGKGHHT